MALSQGASRETRAPVLVVVGTRPEAIKMAPVVLQLERSRLLAPLVVSTGQHEAEVAAILAGVHLKADITLDIPGVGRSLNQLFAAVMLGLEAALLERYGPPSSFSDDGLATRYPVMALVHGDTSSAAAGALAAFHLRMPVAHVEAGLRTWTTRSPFPEELNRQVITRVAALHFAPTTVAKQNLVREAIESERVFVTGNTAIDSLRATADLSLPAANPQVAAVLERLDADPSRRLVIVTAHRRENWGEGLGRIGEAIAKLAAANPGLIVVLPQHPNPAIRQIWAETVAGEPGVVLTEPLAYLDFALLLGRAAFAISDSGGVQEEAPSLGTPVLVTRSSTERIEGLEAGTLQLVGTDPHRIVQAAQHLLDDPAALAAMAGIENPYGDGHAAERIVAAIENVIFRGPKPARFGAGYSRTAVLAATGVDPVLLADQLDHVPQA